MTEVLYHPPKPDLLSDEWEDKNTETATLCDLSLDAEPETPLFDYPPMASVTERDFLTRHERRQLKREAKAERKAKIKHPVLRRLGASALCCSIFAVGAYDAFMYDQKTLSSYAWGDSKAGVNVIWDHHENYLDPETYVYVIPGTGSKDATPRAKLFEQSVAAFLNSKFMGLQEGVHPQIEDTYAAIDDTIDKDFPPDQIILYGVSAGGKEALSIASHLRETFPTINLNIILSSTPYDQDSAYELQGSHNVLPVIADTMDRLNLHGGPVTRLLVEMYNRRSDCFDESGFSINKCIDVAHDVADAKLTNEAASNELFEWQVEWTRVQSAGSDIAAIKNTKDSAYTSILYINTTKDTVVDENEAIPKFAKDAAKNNIPFMVVQLNTSHANEWSDKEEYNNVVLKKYFAAIDTIYTHINATQAGYADPYITRADGGAAIPQAETTASPSNVQDATN